MSLDIQTVYYLRQLMTKGDYPGVISILDAEIASAEEEEKEEEKEKENG